MKYHYDLTKTPKIITRLLKSVRKWRLSNYKKKKVKDEKSKFDRNYFIKFKIIIDDKYNPQKLDQSYEMIVPAKAAFIAKELSVMSIIKKIKIDIIECESIDDNQLEEFEKSKIKISEKIKKI